MSGKVIRMPAQHSAAVSRKHYKRLNVEARDFVDSTVVDHLDGVVGEAEIERAEQQSRDPLEPNWSLS